MVSENALGAGMVPNGAQLAPDGDGVIAGEAGAGNEGAVCVAAAFTAGAAGIMLDAAARLAICREAMLSTAALSTTVTPRCTSRVATANSKSGYHVLTPANDGA